MEKKKEFMTNICSLKQRNCRNPVGPTNNKKPKEAITYVNPQEPITNVNPLEPITFNLSNRYSVTETILGSGAYGAVHLGYDHLINEQVAIKILSKTLLKQAQVERTAREIEIIKICRHPNIVHCFESIETDSSINIVMEYVKCKDMLAYLNHFKRLGEFEARWIFSQILSAIEFCHGHLIVHKDLKLENILVCDYNTLLVKVCDFGFADYVRPNDIHTAWCGSIPYVPPEIIFKQRHTPFSVDVWNMGVILYAMIAGKLPWNIKNGEKASIWDFYNLQYPAFFSKDLINLLSRIFVPFVDRITISEIKEHIWLMNATLPSHLEAPSQRIPVVNMEVLGWMSSMGFKQEQVMKSIIEKIANAENCVYHHLLKNAHHYQHHNPVPKANEKLNISQLESVPC